MRITIPVRPWKGSWQCPLEEAQILACTDRWHDDSPRLPVHVVNIDGVEILCHGFEMGVVPQDGFLTFTVHNIYELSWDAFFTEHDFDDCLDGSGRRSGYMDEDEQLVDTLVWWPGCDLIVPFTELALEPLPAMVLVDG